MWQFGFGFLVPIFVAVAAALWIVVPTRTSPATDRSTLSIENVRHVLSELRRLSLVLATALMILSLSISQAFAGFFPTYLIEIKSLSPGLASGLFALFFALGALIRPLAGNAYDRIGVRRTLLLVTGLSAAGLAALPFVEGLLLLSGVTVVIAFMAGRGTVTLAYMTVSLPSDVQNTGLGVLRTVFFTIGASSPAIFGAIADRGYFDEAFLLLAALSGLGLLVIAWLPPVRE